MRILIYGAGVIGSLYAVLLKEAGYDTTIYARGHRLEALQNQGLLYKKNNIIKKVDIKVIDYLQDNDIYDFIFLTVRENQLYQALKELKSNKSKNIITMVNSIDTYEKWESIVGKGRILPAFPGAGGSITNDILDASLTPRFIQPTTFSEITGKRQIGHSSSYKYLNMHAYLFNRSMICIYGSYVILGWLYLLQMLIIKQNILNP